MLQELDRRQGMSSPDGAMPPQQVRAVGAAEGASREWFWWSVAVLMLAAVGWVGWVAWQLQPRPALVNEQALRAAQSARAKPAAPVSQAALPKPAPEERKAAESFRLALAIETPIREPEARKTAAPEPPKAAAPSAPPPVAKGAQPRLELDVPQARVLAPPATAGARVEKRERAQTPSDRAEAEYRRAAGLLNQARVSEAEEGLHAALALEPAHEAARQTLVALALENRRFEDARRLLQEGLAINPANVQFAVVLARIFVERRELPAALDVLNAARAGGVGNADYHALHGTVLQRLGRHAEAVDAFQNALRVQPGLAHAWVGLGASLEALQKRPEAADAFRRALAAGPASAELTTYAEQRLRALR